MNPPIPSGAEQIDIERICERQLKDHDWRLAHEPVLLTDGRSFVQRVRERVSAFCAEEQCSVDEKLVRRLVKTEYGCLLHRAVSLNGQRVQSRALEETKAYGWPKAMDFARDRQMAEDAITWALNLLWQNIHRCQPEKYFPYFIQILLNAIKQERRKNKSFSDHEIVQSDRRLQADSLDESDESEQGGEHSDSELTNPYKTTELLLAREPLIELLRECLQNERRLHIVFNKIFLQLNASEIADQLRMSVKQVYVETHRALDRIREHCLEILLAELRLRLVNS
jgi:RNA polymerase sigma factor (sigma-70 family)